ncbi:DCC1-like thiol-disulfide oxidoreductase family protein [Flavobacterium sp. J27]|uniref:DCC1-like thiol-disulfide oxidoreductase family protein n=1 Tax=Flavobacterium sp. J27 TaxID=2060419 RepID=UPI001030A0DC|nr:DCC1-like thiol-disulfide oxidoreductase family protein [Flavobacterium sp. J27]
MKTLTNHTLLYDEDCPMCNLYTAGFIKAKMLDENGRKAFVALTDKEQTYIDVDKAKNEIALIDNMNKKVVYGIDSLLKIIGFSFPWIEKIGNWKPVNYLLRKLYKFISYNRKVIAPSKINDSNKLECTPDFNVAYRISYIILTILFTAFVLFQYAKLLSFLSNTLFSKELALALGQIGFQYLFIRKINKQDQLHYIGNLITVSVIGSLFLLPILILNQFVVLHEYITLGWFGITVNLMILEHYRRINLLQLPKHLTLTWILYRILALPFLLNF